MKLPLDPLKLRKKTVGEAAAEYILSDSIVAIGTGSTTAFTIKRLGEKLQSGDLKNVKLICTSYHTKLLAKKSGIPLTSLEETEGKVNLAIDGADEVDLNKILIKGGGASHTQEKVVCAAAQNFIVTVDIDKIVEQLGRNFPVPIEVLPMAITVVEQKIKELGGQPTIRQAVMKDGCVITEQGNMIIDAKFEVIENPKLLETQLNNIPGVLDNGLFAGTNKNTVVLFGYPSENNQPTCDQLEVINWNTFKCKYLSRRSSNEY